MKVIQLFMLLIICLPLTAWAEPSVNTEVQCDKIKGHADQRKCLENRSEESQKGLENTETSYRSALSNAYKDKPDVMNKIVKSFDEASHEFSSYRTKQCNFMAALVADGTAASDRHLSCEIAFNEQRTKILAGELAKLASPHSQLKSIKKAH